MKIATLVSFMQSQLGRGARILLGLVLISTGLAVVQGVAGILIALIGLVPIVMGVWSPCLIGFVLPKSRHV